jgi:hypothetical protein
MTTKINQISQGDKNQDGGVCEAAEDKKKWKLCGTRNRQVGRKKLVNIFFLNFYFFNCFFCHSCLK